ncbi:MAG TPA: SDR family oxidoreductase [Microvirga sp.]|nr:SDR family oxidoreductase [Microvirga sp.]
MNLFAFGLGYTARALVAAERPRLASVAGTVRSPEAGGAWAHRGVALRLFSEAGADPAVHDDLKRAEVVLVSIPPDAGGDPSLRAFGEALAAAPRVRWVGYLSTVGVYGDHGGAWVDEATPPSPMSERARRRVLAEEQWLDWGRRTGRAVHVFRLAGIYGPGRNALVNLAAGTARRIVKPGQVFNRIHVDDIARALVAAMAQARPRAVYNLADDEPAPPQDVVAYAAALLGVEPPPETPIEQATLGAMAASFYAENKRVSNRLIKRELGLAWRYPTYREGLKALAADRGGAG